MKRVVENVRNKVEDFANDWLMFDGVKVIVLGLSGGPDSLCLLDVLDSLSEKYNFDILPVHVNHKLRPKADAEQKHVEEICDSYGWDCMSVEVDCNEVADELGVSVETAGRAIRYSAFWQTAHQVTENTEIEQSEVKIAVAQNANDQSETVLFRIIRGTSPHGLVGIRAVRDQNGYDVIRPLLNVTRDEIEAYIKARDLEPNRDETNDIPEFSRNKLRLELIPEIEEEFNPNFKESLRRLAESAEIEDDYMDSQAYDLMSRSTEIDEDGYVITVHLNIVRDEHPALIMRLVSLIMEIMGAEEDTTFTLVNGICEVMFSHNPSARLDLPNGIRAVRDYDVIRFLLPRDDNGNGIPDHMEDNRRLVVSVIPRKEFSTSGKVCAAFDYDRFEKEHPEGASKIEFRTRFIGDYIPIRGGSKKIQNLFVDEKVSRDKRELIRYAAIGNEVLWIPPQIPDMKPSGAFEKKGKFSQKYQIIKATTRVLFLELV